MRDKKLRAIGAAVVLFGIAVAAILQIGPGGDPSAISLVPEDQEPSATEAVVDEATDAPVTAAPQEPFVYRVGVLAGVSTDNFWAFYNEEASVWNAYILGPTKPALYSLDEAGNLTPELAVDEVSPSFDANGWRARITLNDSFYWSDGEPITAEDFAFTFETVRALQLGGSWADAFPSSIESVHIDSPYELRIEFSERPNLSLWPYGPGLAPLMPKHVWASHVQGADSKTLLTMPGDEDVGGGPLVIEEVGDEVIRSISNPGYPAGAFPDIVEYHVFGNEGDAVQALSAGDIDTILSPKGLTASLIETLSSDPAITVETNPANAVRYLGFNLNREPMNDRAFRNALALLVDKEELAVSIGSEGAAAYAFVNEANTRWFDTTAAKTNAERFKGDLPSRLQDAVESLSQTGYSWTAEPTIASDGSVVSGTGLLIRGLDPAPLTILTPGDAYDPSRPQYAASIAETLGWLGFDVRPVETDFDTVVDLAFTPGEDGLLHYDMYLLGWTLGNPAMPSYYRTLFAADGVKNNTGYNSGEFSEQLTAYESSFDVAEARKALWMMEATLASDLPYLLLYSSSITEAYRSDRVRFEIDLGLGGIQALLGGIGEVRPVS